VKAPSDTCSDALARILAAVEGQRDAAAIFLIGVASGMAWAEDRDADEALLRCAAAADSIGTLLTIYEHWKRGIVLTV
jgi:hypothetical protein